jgi:hypothetical protein
LDKTTEGHLVVTNKYPVSQETGNYSIRECNLLLPCSDDLVDPGDAIVKEVCDPSLVLHRKKKHGSFSKGFIRQFQKSGSTSRCL